MLYDPLNMPDIFVDSEPEEEEKVDEPEKEAPKPQPKKKSSHRPHLFTTYAPNPPSVVFFSDKTDDEVLLLFLRKHLITNLPWLLKAFLLSLIPIIYELLSGLGFFNIALFTSDVKMIVYFFYYFFIFSGYIFVNYLTWFYNISLVTNERIVDIDFSDLVFEDVSATKLSQVEDVNYKQIGFARSLFDYGDILVQTAASTSEFHFIAVPHPEQVIRIINNLIGKESNA